jgi:hypothetical protein
MTLDDLPQITEIQRLRLGPGDHLVLKLDTRKLTEHDVAQVTRMVRDTLRIGSEVAVLVLGSHSDLTVLQQEWVPSGWPTPRREFTDADRALYHELVQAYYDVTPQVRATRSLRWVMDEGWWRRVRAASGDASDPEKWRPHPKDELLGVKIKVRPGGGKPHLVIGAPLRAPGAVGLANDPGT